MMAPLYCSLQLHCIDIATVNIRGPSFYNIIKSFSDS